MSLDAPAISSCYAEAGGIVKGKNEEPDLSASDSCVSVCLLQTYSSFRFPGMARGESGLGRLSLTNE